MVQKQGGYAELRYDGEGTIVKVFRVLSVISQLVERSRVERRFCGFIFGPGRRSSRRDCPELFSRRVEGRRLGSHWKKVSLGRGLARMGFRWKGVSLGCGLVGLGWGGTGQLSRNSFRFN